MISPRNLIKHELIGLEVIVVDSRNKNNIGLSGRVVNETKNTLIIENKGKEKRLIKDACIFVFKLPDGKKVKVKGSLITSRPEDRIKKRPPRTWLL